MEMVSEVNNNQLDRLIVNRGEALTEISWNSSDTFDQAWLFIDDKEYDLIQTDTGYTVTVLTEDYRNYEEISIAGLKNDVMYSFK